MSRQLQRTTDANRIGWLASRDGVQPADDDRQQIVEVVGDAARQLAHGFHLLGVEERLASLSQFLFGVLPVRNVPSDLGETDQLTSIIANGVDDYVGPEAATVLAQAPPFRLPTAL